MSETASGLPSGAPPAGTLIEVRDEEWLVRSSDELRAGEYAIDAIGASELVRGHSARFLTALDGMPRVLRPEDTRLEVDGSDGYRVGRLFLEAVRRRLPLPQGEQGLALTEGFLLDRLDYQLRPAVKALANRFQPRLLIGDVVGLGKTLEIGILLGELIRRGRGERILVVTPAPVLEQFQHEMWTRFSLPLVRLDSAGISRIERKIPVGRNPFTYYKRVIVSMDTLKNQKRYGPWLRDVEWDAVVMDESHNLLNRGSDRRELAEVLARQTDALVLASATPHNGEMRAFTGLVRLLDPMAVRDAARPRAEELHHLMVRRTKVSDEVARVLEDKWAPRGDSRPLRVRASELEEEVFAELAAVWLSDPGAGRSGARGDERLFPYVLLKSFLSSHRALFATAREKLATLGHALPEGHKQVADPSPAGPAESPAAREVVSLLRLTELARRIELTAADGTGVSAKLAGLVAELRDEVKVGPGRAARAVVFSERRETLNWLGTVLPPLLGWSDPKDGEAAVKVMHSGVSDTVQMGHVDEFARAGGDIRVLLTGDGASEGVNLHRQCHHLIHWDLPWSLIRVEQRNGRIDRYGQTRRPEFRALLLTSGVEGALDDRTVAEKVLAREARVHEVLGAVEAVTRENDGDREERRVMEALLGRATSEEAVADLEAVPVEAFASGEGDGTPGTDAAALPVERLTMSEFGTGPAPVGSPAHVASTVTEAGTPDGSAFGAASGLDLDIDLDDFGDFAPPADGEGTEEDGSGRGAASGTGSSEAPASDIPTVEELRFFSGVPERNRQEFVLAGLAELPDLGGLRAGLTVAGTDLSFEPPRDLADRFDVLPPGYVRDQGITRRINLTFSREDAADSLRRAREDAGSTSLWPDAHYVGELHPVVEWITDRVLVEYGRQQALVLQVGPEKAPDPVFLTQGVWSNAEGRPTAVVWLAIDQLGSGTPRTRELTPGLLAALGVGPGMPDHWTPSDAATTLQPLVRPAVEETRRAMQRVRDVAEERVDGPLRDLERGIAAWRQQTLPGFEGGKPKQREAADRLARLAARLRTAGEPMVRVLAVLEAGS
ncbi:DEAD/DEAH box helicase [Streptomyces sp. KMM 9044]|uniref:DEAD/DEAH box helicase n=1 Tax=Streptomyces sp. KMM 9044 TaxID=2744474 RepID=UPI002151B867|nr:DEAD/DEAH box helicase [Streptomyces sp. KMM 9044]WAX77960.1 DEAD/DEAH box helicase [Streptomyces sp. KMM 9044]